MLSGRNKAVKGGTGAVSTPANNGGGDAGGDASGSTPRRGSQSGTLFSGLVNQKRNSTDATAAARRQSFADQKPTAGIFGKMWSNYTTGKPQSK